MSRVAVYDLETMNAPRNGEDWRRYDWLGISWGVVWVSWEGGQAGRLRHFRGEKARLGVLVALLNEADVVVSYNGSHFDEKLLFAKGFEGVFDPKADCDMLSLIYRVMGRRYKLDDMALHTLGRQKSGHGKHAPALARAGRIDELAEYCQDDVILTRDLYYFARAHGYVITPDGRCPLQVHGGVSPSPLWKPNKEQKLRSHGNPMDKATPKQLQFIKELQNGQEPPDWLNKAQASEMIDRLIRQAKTLTGSSAPQTPPDDQ